MNAHYMQGLLSYFLPSVACANYYQRQVFCVVSSQRLLSELHTATASCTESLLINNAVACVQCC